MALTRRDFLRGLTAAGLLSVAQGRAAPPVKRPNLLLILADDLGFSDIGCYGSEIPTPRLDALAEGGVRFGRFLNAARCCPARASLLTGQWPHQTGVGYMASNAAWSARYFINEWYAGDLHPETRTLAEVLHTAGYGTYCVGKWHVTRHTDPGAKGFSKANWPCSRGFDHYYGKLVGAGSGGGYFDTKGIVRDETFLPVKKDGLSDYFTRACADEAIAFLHDHRKERPDAPFFMYLAFTAPHLPLQAPQETVARHKGKYDAGYEAIRNARLVKQKMLGIIPPETPPPPLPANWAKVRRKAFEARCMEVYAAMIEEMDTAIGRVIDALRDQGCLNDTLILFLSDNGACAEDTGRSPDAPLPGGPETRCGYGKAWAAVSNTPFREYKHWTHEGGIATPCIAHWPAGIPPRKELLPAPCHLVDIMATLPALTGQPFPEDMPPPEGVSLLPLLRGESLPERIHPLLFEHEGNRALVQGRWKLVAKGPKGPWELYNTETDRNELRDLAAAQPERLRHMIEVWESEARRTHIFPSPFMGERPAPRRESNVLP